MKGKLDGQVVEGFDRDDGCVIHDLDTPSRQVEHDRNGGALLTWHGKPLSALAGRPVRLRFYFRDARIYDVRY